MNCTYRHRPDLVNKHIRPASLKQEKMLTYANLNLLFEFSEKL